MLACRWRSSLSTLISVETRDVGDSGWGVRQIETVAVVPRNRTRQSSMEKATTATMTQEMCVCHASIVTQRQSRDDVDPFIRRYERER